MRVVSNTSPLSNLAVIGRLDLLKRRYGTVSIPPAVKTELSALSHTLGKARIDAALADGWLIVDTRDTSPPPEVAALDAGETDAIALAQAIQADVLLIDERAGRQAARQIGIVVAGVLGELLYAKRHGVLPSLRDEIQRLRSDAGFFIDAEIERFLLSEAAE